MPLKPRKNMISEASVQASVLEYLKLCRISAWRMNSGATKVQSGDLGRARFVRWNHKPGMSDICGVLPLSPSVAAGRALFIECKAPRKGKLSELQKSFLDEMASQGALAFVAESVEDVRKTLKENGYEVP